MDVLGLGTYIREQRRNSRLTLKKLSGLTGVSMPYLSQVERGLRKPSADIMQGIAKGLRISAETLYVQAGILEDRPVADVASAIMSDPLITERQKQALVQIYEAFREETARAVPEVFTTPSAPPKSRRTPARKVGAKTVALKRPTAPKQDGAAPSKPRSPQRARARTSKEA
jgi:transcriptional regulator with XRE-family HTH domain